MRLLGKQQDFLEFTGISSEERAAAGQPGIPGHDYPGDKANVRQNRTASSDIWTFRGRMESLHSAMHIPTAGLVGAVCTLILAET